jgi:DNA-binding NarL/FixJ family response regulator
MVTYSFRRGQVVVNIIIVESNLFYRKGLVSILGDCPEFRVVCEASDSCEAVAEASEIQPDIVVMDIPIGVGKDAEAIALLKQKFPGVKVIVLTLSAKEDDFLEAMKAGARGYLLKSVAPVELIECIHLVASGDVIVSPSKAVDLFEEFGQSNNSNKDWGERLSPREKEVLRLVAQGSSNKEIAAHCYVSETTIKAHLRKILEKLQVKNRAEAVALAATKGLLDQQ